MEQKVSLKLLLHGLPNNSIVTCRAVCEVPAFGIVTKFYLRLATRSSGNKFEEELQWKNYTTSFSIEIDYFQTREWNTGLNKVRFLPQVVKAWPWHPTVYEWRRLLFTTGYSSDHSFHRCCRQHQKHWMLENERTYLDHKISRRPFCYSVSNFDLFSLVWSPIFPELGHFKTITQAQLFSFFSMSFF